MIFSTAQHKLADCIDTTNGYLVTNADALRKVVNAAEEATLSDLKMAEAHEKLNYHELVGQLYDVTDGLESYDEATLIYSVQHKAELTHLHMLCSVPAPSSIF